jgi:hypothetical protein
VHFGEGPVPSEPAHISLPHSRDVGFDLVVTTLGRALRRAEPANDSDRGRTGDENRLTGGCPACGSDLEVLLTRFHPQFPNVEEARVWCTNQACGYTAWRQLDPSHRQLVGDEGEAKSGRG